MCSTFVDKSNTQYKHFLCLCQKRARLQESVPMREAVKYVFRDIATRYKDLLSGRDMSKVLATVVLTECQVPHSSLYAFSMPVLSHPGSAES
jgi:hypothetical protein